MENFFPPGDHTDFLVVYTPSWDPQRVCATSVHVEPGISLDEAIREVPKTMTRQTGKNRWIVCDDGTLLRPEDVVAVQVLVVTAEDVEPAERRQPFGFTLGADGGA